MQLNNPSQTHEEQKLLEMATATVCNTLTGRVVIKLRQPAM